MTNSEMTVAAIVPMRHSSERVRGKNYRLFAGKPLYHHVLTMLGKSRLVHEIVVDTDSELMTDAISQDFPSVKILERPANLRDGATDMNDVLANTLTSVDSEIIVQTHSTNPSLSTATLDTGIELFLDSRPAYDSLFSVNRFQARLWDSHNQPVNHSLDVLRRTQDLPPLWTENSCLYVFSKTGFLSSGRRIGNSPILFETPPLESLDIDTESDFVIAETIHRLLQTSGSGVKDD